LLASFSIDKSIKADKNALPPPLRYAPCLAASLPRQFAERANRQRRATARGCKSKSAQCYAALQLKSFAGVSPYLYICYPESSVVGAKGP